MRLGRSTNDALPSAVQASLLPRSTGAFTQTENTIGITLIVLIILMIVAIFVSVIRISFRRRRTFPVVEQTKQRERQEDDLFRGVPGQPSDYVNVEGGTVHLRPLASESGLEPELEPDSACNPFDDDERESNDTHGTDSEDMSEPDTASQSTSAPPSSHNDSFAVSDPFADANLSTDPSNLPGPRSSSGASNVTTLPAYSEFRVDPSPSGEARMSRSTDRPPSYESKDIEVGEMASGTMSLSMGER